MVAQNITALLTLGSFQAGIMSGALALVLNADGTKALDASGTPVLAGGGFNNISATSVHVQYNDTGTDYQRGQQDDHSSTGSAGRSRRAPAPRPSPLVGVEVFGLQAGLAGLATITADVGFQKGASAAGTPIIKAAVANLGLSFGDGTTTYVVVSQGQGGLLVTSDGIAGTLTAHVTLAERAGREHQRHGLQPRPEQHDEAVNDSFTIGATTFPINLPAGPLLRVTADPLSLTFAGVTLTGQFGFLRSTKTTGETITVVSAQNISIPSFTAGGTLASAINITGASGTLVLTPQGIGGNLTFTAAVAFSSFSAGATVILDINRTSQAIDADGPFGSIHLDAGPFFQFELSNLTITLPGRRDHRHLRLPRRHGQRRLAADHRRHQRPRLHRRRHRAGPRRARPGERHGAVHQGLPAATRRASSPAWSRSWACPTSPSPRR